MCGAQFKQDIKNIVGSAKLMAPTQAQAQTEDK